MSDSAVLELERIVGLLLLALGTTRFKLSDDERTALTTLWIGARCGVHPR